MTQRIRLDCLRPVSERSRTTPEIFPPSRQSIVFEHDSVARIRKRATECTMPPIRNAKMEIPGTLLPLGLGRHTCSGIVSHLARRSSYSPIARREGRAAMEVRILNEFRSIVGKEGLITEREQLSTYECDGLTMFRVLPLAVLLPTSTGQVQAIVRVCCREKIPFV